MKIRTPAQIGALWMVSAFVAGAGAETYGNYNKTVVVGGNLVLGHYASVQADCSLRGPTTVRVTGEPSSGSVGLRRSWGYSHFTNDYQRCNAAKVLGEDAIYTPHKGFAGTDSVQLDVIYPSGLERVENFSITVK